MRRNMNGSLRETKMPVSKRRRLFVESDEHMGSTRQHEWYETVQDTVKDLVRINLVDRPNQPITERARDSQPKHEVTELEEGQVLKDASGSPPDPIERLWPVKVEDVCVPAVPAQPNHLEPGAVDNLDADVLEVAVQDLLVRVDVVPRKVGETRSGH